MATQLEQLALLEDVRGRIVRELTRVNLEKIQLEEELAELDSEIDVVTMNSTARLTW